jgi:hypothetical protein
MMIKRNEIQTTCQSLNAIKKSPLFTLTGLHNYQRHSIHQEGNKDERRMNKNYLSSYDYKTSIVVSCAMTHVWIHFHDSFFFYGSMLELELLLLLL